MISKIDAFLTKLKKKSRALNFEINGDLTFFSIFQWQNETSGHKKMLSSPKIYFSAFSKNSPNFGACYHLPASLRTEIFCTVFWNYLATIISAVLPFLKEKLNLVNHIDYF